MIHPKSALGASLSLMVLASILLLSALPGLEAQSTSRRPKPRPVEPAATPVSAGTSAVRFWKTDLAGFPILRVVLRPAGTKSPVDKELGSGGPGFIFNEYISVPVGHGVLELYGTPAPGAGKPEPPPLASLPVDFAANGFSTVLVDAPGNAGGAPKLIFIEDRGPGEPGTVAAAQITVRNFVPGLKDAHVTISGVLDAQFATDGSFLVMRGMKPAVCQLQTAGTTADGKPFQWNAEADLQQHQRQTLLIYPDPYGRIRPRLTLDGENTVAEQPPTRQDGQR